MIFQAQVGDQAAMQWLYQAYIQRVYSLAYRLLCHQADAQDVMQDAFVKCFKCLHQYRGDAPFWSWLRQIVSTTALMHMRGNKRRGAQLGVDEVVGEPALVSPQRAGHAAAQAELEAALSCLPDLSRMVVWLYHVEGHTHAEIAQSLGRSVSFSKSRLARAQVQLRQILNAEPLIDGRASTAARTTPDRSTVNPGGASGVLFEANQ